MSATPKKRSGESEKKKGKRSANGNAKKKSSTVQEMQRINELYKLYLESSGDESELSEDAWEEGEYEIDKIVDESVDMAGNHKYQVLWKNWKRKSDGTSTTWVRPENLGSEAEEALEDWKVEKKRRIIERRKRYAETGYPVSLFAHGCFTRFNTTLEELGMGDDQVLTPDMIFPSAIDTALDWEKEVEETMAIAMAHMTPKGTSSGSDLPRPQASAANVYHMDSESTPRAPRVDTHRTLSDSTHYATPMSSVPQEILVDSGDEVDLLPRPRKRGLSLEPSSSSSNRSAKRVKNGKGKGIETDRTILQDAWDRATFDEKAARVVLVNDIDDELIPSSVNLDTFVYLERGPYRHDGTLTSHASFLEGCTCESGCTDPRRCLCQGEEHADEIWEGTKRVFAYDKNGIYRFPRVSVTECNDNCQCDLTCPNRVAQRPRDVPMEVFKTQDRGWGVRATVPIKKGKVLGVFTGDLRPSEESTWTRSQDDKHWSYELDWFDGPHKWRVTTKDCGNWSRFLNHSCFPNLKVYGVVYDSVTNAGEDNRHRLGFVATQDIEPFTELLIDYSPQYKPANGEQCCPYGGCAR